MICVGLIICLTCIIIILLLLNAYNGSLRGVLFLGNFDYCLMNEKINKCYVIMCYTIIGEKMNILTHSVSHHAFLVITDNLKCIVSRIRNFVQVLEIKSIDNGKITDIENYEYGLLESFELKDITVNAFLKAGEEICSKHNYSYFNHNCQEFVYDMLKHYDVILAKNFNKYRGKWELFFKGISEIMNDQFN